MTFVLFIYLDVMKYFIYKKNKEMYFIIRLRTVLTIICSLMLEIWCQLRPVFNYYDLNFYDPVTPLTAI